MDENRDQTGGWLPPNRSTGDSNYIKKIYRWNARDQQSLTDVTQQAVPSVYTQRTVYHHGGKFWVVPYDATEYNVGSMSTWWRALTFEHLPNNGVSSVTCAGTELRLAAQRPDQLWLQQLFPDGYWANPPTVQPGGLQGDLALILALGAFSAPRGRTAAALSTSFKVGRWVPHHFSHGREYLGNNSTTYS